MRGSIMSFNRRAFLRNVGLVSMAGIQSVVTRKDTCCSSWDSAFLSFWNRWPVFVERGCVARSNGHAIVRFDNANGCIFTLQLTYGGGDGDLTLTKLSLPGNRLGYMLHTGFGHGVSFGAELVGTSTYLWTEVDSAGTGADARV
jgi:hypothetical protein